MKDADIELLDDTAANVPIGRGHESNPVVTFSRHDPTNAVFYANARQPGARATQGSSAVPSSFETFMVRVVSWSWPNTWRSRIRCATHTQ